ncbi:MAG TPA: ROK family protein [Verrucomicrobiae bacterium]|nr:ROK family protein [Verrucomicrobiae bacterium]
MSNYALGIDLGGTNIKGLAVTPGGEVLQQTRVETGDEGDERWQENVRRLVMEISVKRGEAPGWIGVAAPGLPARDRRSISVMPGRLRGLEGLVWGEYLHTNAPVPVSNDAHAALLGEGWQGAARGARNAVLVTLGTGVGGAVMCDGRLLRGHLGRAGHLGHMALDFEGPPDVVGTPGSLEVAIGECTVGQRSGGKFATTRDLVTAHLNGDRAATEVWLRSVKALGAALASFVNLFDPEVIVIGGGIAQSGPALFEPLEKHLRAFEWHTNGFRVPVVAAQLGEWSGAYGAAKLALDHGG